VFLFFFLLLLLFLFRKKSSPPPIPAPAARRSSPRRPPLKPHAAAAAAMTVPSEGDDAANKGTGVVPPPPSYRSLAAPVASPVDKFALLPAFLKVRGLVKEHIDSFNYFITKGIRNIIHANNRIEARNDPNIYLRYTNVSVGKPSIQVDYKVEDITPHFCRLTDRT
jgi:DNA-directed RNA polymerase III subunit RPC2